MNISRKWWFWLIVLTIIGIIILILALYQFKEAQDFECSSPEECDKCGNGCIPLSVSIRASCPAPSEDFQCACIDNQCTRE